MRRTISEEETRKNWTLSCQRETWKRSPVMTLTLPVRALLKKFKRNSRD